MTSFLKALLRILLKTIKVIVIAFLILIALFILVMVIGRQYDYFKNKGKEIIVFEEVKDDFDAVNNFIIENFGDEPIEEYVEISHNRKLTSIYESPNSHKCVWQ